jgi:glycerol uptake facilitator-like aquaporin
MFQAISWEFMFTFALVYVYFATAVDPRRKTPDHPIAVGFVGVTSVIVAGPFTGE